jgi:hypothetical protein
LRVDAIHTTQRFRYGVSDPAQCFRSAPADTGNGLRYAAGEGAYR